IPQMNPDADVNLLGFLLLGIVGTEVGLNVLRTLHGVHDGGKVDQEAIAHGFDDLAVVFCDRLLNQLVMHFQQPQHARFIGPHLAAEAYDVSEHNGRQATGLASYCTRTVLGHSRDYRARTEQLSNGPSWTFSLPWCARRSKEAACAVQAAGLRIPRG